MSTRLYYDQYGIPTDISERACLVKCVTGVFIVVFPRLASGRRR